MSFGFPAYHTEKYTSNENNSDLRTAVNSTLKTLSWSVREEKPDTIITTSSVNLLSWGEEIIIVFLPNNSISVTSQCAFPLQCVDWGKNKSNIKKFITELKRYS